MSSSTTTISSKNSTMNNNDRKRPISSSIRPSPSPPSSKRHSLSSTNLQNSTTKKNFHRLESNEILLKKSTDHNDRQSRPKQLYRHIDNKSSSSESSRSSSNSNHSINQEYSSTTPIFNSTNDIQSSNEIVTAKRSQHYSINHSKQKSDVQKDFLYTKKPPALALIVKPSSSNIDQRNFGSISDSDDEYEQPKQISNKVFTKPPSVIVPSSVMTIVKTPDLSKKSIRTDNVIIQQSDGNINSNPSTKLVKLVVPQTTTISSSSSIKMLSSGDGLASALRIPAKIQLTKTLFVSSVKNDETSSLISSANLLDIQDNTPTLPPTPPPPVIDNTNSNIRNVLSHHTSNNQQQKINEITTIDSKAIEEVDPSMPNEHSNHQNTPKRHLSTVSDWCVPPTSELSPTSLTSSSPDLTQNSLPIDDSLVELDSTMNCRKSTKRRHRSASSSSVLPSFTMSYLQSNKTTLLKPIKSKPSTRLLNSSDMKVMLNNNNNNKKRSSRTSPVLKLSSAQRIRKRRHKNENIIHNQQNSRCSKVKTKRFQTDDIQFIIKDILNGIIERITSTNYESDNALKMLLNTSIPQIKHKLPISRITTRQPKTEIVLRTNSVNRKHSSSLQSLDSIVPNESRSMTMTSRELDELAYLLHANVHRGDYEQIDNPAKVEERMREMWSQMTNQKKNSYKKRVIEIYKKPNRDTVIASSSSLSSTNENNSLLSNDLTNDTATSSLAINSLSLELRRQTSTPLSFHSIPSSTIDEQSIISPEESNLKTNLSTDIVNEIIKGAKGLDKLSSSPTDFINSIRNFIRLSIDNQTQIVNKLQQQIEKKCPTQFNRAQIFWTQKIRYFANKYQINSSSESVHELTLIVKYFYLLVLSLNCQKQEAEFQAALTNRLNGNLTSADESYCSPTLTSIIEDLILPSSLANEYLASQLLIINNNEYSLPFIRNTELENELLNNNDIDISVNPFSNYNDLDDYLKRCENMTTTIPSYSIQQPQHPPMYYPAYHPTSQYYYSPSQSTDMNNYYYNNPTPAYQNSQQQQQQQIYSYGPSTSYYHPSTTYNNEQSNYYYNSQQQQQQQSLYSYSSQTNSTNDIPLSNNPSLHRTYRQMNPNMQRLYRNPQQSTTSGATSIISGTPSTSAVFDGTTVVSPQSKSMNTTNNNYPP
ncbi:unnamed protein product [Adineta steineri]|uniref:Uncharacterized protein n=2 Tax=Adineta steineri TaxID=433720 RepID=A0A813R8U1_9BILA|nr:unnamed protein product [Adineta steineri]CAF3510261.1 unnamed protein product [Adineta steineri]